MRKKKKIKRFKKKNKHLLLGKTIKDFNLRQHSEASDLGYLDIYFTDNTSITMIATYGAYDDKALDEYPTNIRIVDSAGAELTAPRSKFLDDPKVSLNYPKLYPGI